MVHSFPHYFTILPMITLNGTECGAFISSLFHHFAHDHTQWDRVWCIHFLIISPFYQLSHSMGPSVVHSFPPYFTILSMITINGTEYGAFISSLFHHFTHDHIQWDPVWCIYFLIILPSVVPSSPHLFHHIAHDHTQWDRVWCIHFFKYFTILPMITLNGTECGAFVSSLFHHFTHDHTQWDRVLCIHFFIISPFCP